MGRDRPKHTPPKPIAYRYILFYKPYNVLCQFTDEAAAGSGQKAEGQQQRTEKTASTIADTGTISEAVKPLAVDPKSFAQRQTLKNYIAVPDVYPVGRLDQDSEGLMLLTNDGTFQHRLSHPKFQHPRTYWVQVERIPDEVALHQLRQGVTIQGYRTRPAQVKLLDEEPVLPPRDPPIRFRKNVPTSWLEMTLTEGRNRQVRRMTASVGFPTLRLVRVGIVDLRLSDLAPGQWRDLTPNELERVNQVMRSRPTKSV